LWCFLKFSADLPKSLIVGLFISPGKDDIMAVGSEKSFQYMALKGEKKLMNPAIIYTRRIS
jgi:hypothetical protein